MGIYLTVHVYQTLCVIYVKLCLRKKNYQVVEIYCKAQKSNVDCGAHVLHNAHVPS